MEENHHIILFSALDWGLGHTTRSIPILTHFNETGHQLLIAVQQETASEKILQQHFPDAIFLPLKGYCITYAKKRKYFALKIITQIPKILKAIRREHRFVNKTVQSYPIHLILSDNRYGFYHRSVPSVFITHQLRITAPYKLLENLIQRINYGFIEKFSALWIPDLAGQPNIGGRLSHPVRMPAIPAHYLGPLSRLAQLPLPDSSIREHRSILPFKYLFLLSGPEPQRSILEKRLLETAHQLKGQIILVRGLPADTPAPGVMPYATENPAGLYTPKAESGLTQPEKELRVITYAEPDTLRSLLENAEYVVCRSGYSTVMDLLILGKKGIYIPTPGQTEQEYLAKRLMEQHWGYSFEQQETDYLTQFKQVASFNYKIPTDFSAISLQVPQTNL